MYSSRCRRIACDCSYSYQSCYIFTVYVTVNIGIYNICTVCVCIMYHLILLSHTWLGINSINRILVK